MGELENYDGKYDELQAKYDELEKNYEGMVMSYKVTEQAHIKLTELAYKYARELEDEKKKSKALGACSLTALGQMSLYGSNQQWRKADYVLWFRGGAGRGGKCLALPRSPSKT